MRDCLGHIGLWVHLSGTVLIKLFDGRGPSPLWAQHHVLFWVLNSTKVEKVSGGSMHAFIPSALDFGSSGSSSGFIVFLRSNLGQVIYPVFGLLSEKEASINENGDCGGSAGCCLWLCDWLVVFCFLKVEELQRHHSRERRALPL